MVIIVVLAILASYFFFPHPLAMHICQGIRVFLAPSHVVSHLTQWADCPVSIVLIVMSICGRNSSRAPLLVEHMEDSISHGEFFPSELQRIVQAGLSVWSFRGPLPVHHG